MNEDNFNKKFDKKLEEQKKSTEDDFDHPINTDESSEENNIWNLLLELYGLTYDKCVKMVDEKPEVYACKTNPYTEGAPYGMSFYPGGEKAYEREGPDGKSSKKEIRVNIENNIGSNIPRNKRYQLIIGGSQPLNGKIEPLRRNIYVSYNQSLKQYEIRTEYGSSFVMDDLWWNAQIKEKLSTKEKYEEYKNDLFAMSPLYNENFSSIESLENFLIKIVTKQITDDFKANR